ncbi:nuclear transport factor 2 family protein [Mucilaginibacter sp. FT3.2]|uniref:nuclear transport factor 2 family protein n=1 Tax=Mucilaginibacter sp. FT3.2 TaxID=2723090 RepID=UPI00161B9D13|nr:nuclear transport factor 2 family protein [Mucilaginibacter sp. FT3.2]MBB6232337.1 hypothetical protein [Mucilaginibacter sp. FT3.2]
MKIILSIFFVAIACHGLAQTPSEAALLKFSNKIFKWETDNQVDSLEKTFEPKFVVVGASGEIQTKKEYITRLRGGNFVHNAIDIQDCSANILNNTGTVIGKGIFTVTINGKKVSLRLSYIEVFTRPEQHRSWTLLAMHASALQN